MMSKSRNECQVHKVMITNLIIFRLLFRFQWAHLQSWWLQHSFPYLFSFYRGASSIRALVAILIQYIAGSDTIFDCPGQLLYEYYTGVYMFLRSWPRAEWSQRFHCRCLCNWGSRGWLLPFWLLCIWLSQLFSLIVSDFIPTA